MKKRILSMLLTLSMLVGIMAMTAVPSLAAHPFTDVPDWATEYVNEVYEKGIMNGTGGTTFGSNATLTREQLVVTLYRISGSTVTGTLDSLKATFADAADISDWAWSAVEWASKEGITSGVKQGDALYFKPKNDVTRQEAAKFFITFIDYMKLDAPTDNVANLKDMDKVGDWALPYVERCIAAGIINGDGNGNFDPTGKTVRIAAAKMLACLPEASGNDYKLIRPDLKIESKDPKDYTSAATGKISLGSATRTDEFSVSYATVLNSGDAKNQFTATGIGVHGWHETRVVRTEYGTYVVFAQDERLGDSYEAYSSTPENPTWNTEVIGKFYLVKITSDGFKKVLEGEFPVHAGSCAPNVLAGNDGMLYVTTFSDDKDTYYGSLDRTQNPPFTKEGAFLTVYEFDTKTDTLIHSEHEVLEFKKIGVHGYGYYQPILDRENGKIYALFTGGLCPGYFSWFIYDLETHKWEPTNYLVETTYRCSYFHAYADGKGGIFFVAQANPHTEEIEKHYNNEIKFMSTGYVFDSLYLYRIPSMYEEEYVEDGLYVPDYRDRKTFPDNGGLIQPAHAAHYTGGVSYIDSQGYLYVFYEYANPKKSSYMYVVYDTNKLDADGKFVKVRNNKDISFKTKSNCAYQFAMTETMDGELYLIAIDTTPKEAELEIYKIDISQGNILTSVLKDKDGKAASVKIPYKDSKTYVNHARLAFTTTRNYSIQDNVLGILTHEDGGGRGISLFDDPEYIKMNKEGSISTMNTSGGSSTDNLVYYTIKFGK